MKCQCCKNEQATFAWQPFGPDENPACYTTLGGHYRGFPIIKACFACKSAFTTGDFDVEFVYQRKRYVGHNHEINEKIYATLEDAQAAMDHGETVQVQLQSFPVDPYLLQLALDLQNKQRLEDWKAQQEVQA